MFTLIGGTLVCAAVMGGMGLAVVLLVELWPVTLTAVVVLALIGVGKLAKG